MGEKLPCREESNNIHDMYAVSVERECLGECSIVGHVPKAISTPSHLFLRKGGKITCEMSGPREFSRDLPQGGLDVPCRYIFESEDLKLMGKLRNLMDDTPPYYHKISMIKPKEAMPTNDTVPREAHNNPLTDVL